MAADGVDAVVEMLADGGVVVLSGVDAVVEMLADGGVVVLSGAGLSTESGIPDYRGPTGRARRGEPMTFQTFTATAGARQRYWARAQVGWHQICRAAPNAGHRCVAALEGHGIVESVLTQNVDGLHQAAGSTEVLELHGSLHAVRCLDCGARSARAELARRLAAANPGWRPEAYQLHPDGDAVLGDRDVASFRVVGCVGCGGMLAPDVIFFGENVPAPRVQRSYELVSAARVLLVLGSSLTVMSGYRFARRAVELGIPLIIINQGPTRADHLAAFKLELPLGPTLQTLLRRLAERQTSRAVPEWAVCPR